MTKAFGGFSGLLNTSNSFVFHIYFPVTLKCLECLASPQPHCLRVMPRSLSIDIYMRWGPENDLDLSHEVMEFNPVWTGVGGGGVEFRPELLQTLLSLIPLNLTGPSSFQTDAPEGVCVPAVVGPLSPVRCEFFSGGSLTSDSLTPSHESLSCSVCTWSS